MNTGKAKKIEFVEKKLTNNNNDFNKNTNKNNNTREKNQQQQQQQQYQNVSRKIKNSFTEYGCSRKSVSKYKTFFYLFLHYLNLYPFKSYVLQNNTTSFYGLYKLLCFSGTKVE